MIVLIALPIVRIFEFTADARRNVVYWDEFDTALALALKLDEGTTFTGFLTELSRVSNEHRMVTSRLLFAFLYWTTGSINFALLDLIGNGMLVAAVGVLACAAGGAARGARGLRLGVVLAWVLFQLEHHENFLWSGASIDHFQVILLAAGALALAAGGTRAALLGGALLATLATFTLAHGLAVWPVGALALAHRRRWRDLALWSLLGLAAAAVFFADFRLNPDQSFARLSPAGALQVLHYWLALLGASPAMKGTAAAPWFGALLLGLLAWLAARGALRRERVLFPLVCFAVVAAGLIAAGRAELSGGMVNSRYHVLSGVAWALAIFLVLERHTSPRRPYPLLLAALPGLLAFNLGANHAYAGECAAWLTCRDMAVVDYQRHGADGRGPFPLHPLPARSTALLRQAEAAGLYRLGPVCVAGEFPPDARASERISFFLEEVMVQGGAATIRGWAAIPGRTCARGDLQLLLRGGEATHAYTVVRMPRTDVVQVTGEAGWLYSGFQFTKRLDRLPAGAFEIGLLLETGGAPEFVLTGRHLELPAR